MDAQEHRPSRLESSTLSSTASGRSSFPTRPHRSPACARVLRDGGRFAAASWGTEAQNPVFPLIGRTFADLGFIPPPPPGQDMTQPGGMASMADPAKVRALLDRRRLHGHHRSRRSSRTGCCTASTSSGLSRPRSRDRSVSSSSGSTTSSCERAKDATARGGRPFLDGDGLPLSGARGVLRRALRAREERRARTIYAVYARRWNRPTSMSRSFTASTSRLYSRRVGFWVSSRYAVDLHGRVVSPETEVAHPQLTYGDACEYAAPFEHPAAGFDAVPFTSVPASAPSPRWLPRCHEASGSRAASRLASRRRPRRD